MIKKNSCDKIWDRGRKQKVANSTISGLHSNVKSEELENNQQQMCYSRHAHNYVIDSQIKSHVEDFKKRGEDKMKDLKNFHLAFKLVSICNDSISFESHNWPPLWLNTTAVQKWK